MKHFLLLFSLLLLHSNSSTTSTIKNHDDPVIDLMVVYTPAAAAEQTSEGVDIKDWIEEAVFSTNQAMRNSLVNLHVDLVHSAQISYAESTTSTDLKNLTDGINGLKKVHEWRDTYHADAVILLTKNNQGGLAHSLMNLTGDYANDRFAIVKSGSASTFIHEFGHLLGAQHDDKSSGSLPKAIYSYSYGYTGSEYGATTLVGGFIKGTNTYGKINFFSNPALKFRNMPLGDISTGNNARTFNQTASTVSYVRNSKARWTGTVDNNWNNPNNWEDKVVPRLIDDVFIANHKSNYPVISSGTIHARNVEIAKKGNIKMSGGQFNVRGNFIVLGSFTATGGQVNFSNNMMKPMQLEMSEGAHFYDLTFGDEKHQTLAQLGSSIYVKGNITFKKASVLDPNGQSIKVDGNWSDFGNGFDYTHTDVSIRGTASAAASPLNFPIAKNPNGSSYSSYQAGWSSVAEFGNQGGYWMFGGADGMAYLTSKNYYRDNINYMGDIDAWLFIPTTALQAGVEYELVLDYKTQNNGHERIVTVHYGDVQLPSRMTAIEGSTTVPSDGLWSTITKTVKVVSGGFHDIGIRSFHKDEQFETYSYIRNVSLTPKVTIPENFGNAKVTNTSTPTTAPTAPCAAAAAKEQYNTVMKPGERLLEGNKMVSANGKYQLRATNEGDFIIEEVMDAAQCKFRLIWQAPIAGPINNPPSESFLSINPDCNVCTISKQNKGWCATTGRDDNVAILYSCEKAVLTDDGRLTLVSNTGRESWSTTNPYIADVATKKFQTTMYPGDKLYEGEKLVSANGKYQLRGTRDGRFLIEEIPVNPTGFYKKKWIAPIGGRLNNPPNVSVFSFNPDCNLCVSSKQNKGWCATNGIDVVTPIIIYKCQKAVLTDDGRLVLINPQGQEIWSTE